MRKLALVVVIAGSVVVFAALASLWFAHASRSAYLNPQNAALRQQALQLLSPTKDQEYGKAADLLDQAARKSDALAKMQWCYVEWQDLGRKDASVTDAAKAVAPQVQALADKGNAEAAYLLSRYYSTFALSPQTQSEVFSYAQLAAKGKYTPAYSYIGGMYELGYYTKKDAGAAAWCYQQAAAAGDVEAMYRLGAQLTSAANPRHNYAQGLAWYKRAADGGYRPAFYAAAWCLRSGIGAKADAAASLEYLRKGADAKDANSMYNLGLAYFHGDGVKLDLVAARKLFVDAAAAGSKEATQALAAVDAAGKKK